ncbi:MAG: Sphingolipid ceramide N-deacylase [Frankiales bacterium]|nr:Sphingolipid ceramide N-deacylase [Frankiales bacterium]
MHLPVAPDAAAQPATLPARGGRRAGTVRALLALSAVVLTGTGAWAEAKSSPAPTSAQTVPFALAQDRDVDDRLGRPEDRFAVAGGCYTLEAAGAGFVGEGLTLTRDAKAAEPFHFQATRLGEYLIATNEGRDTTFEGAWWDVRGYLAAAPARPVTSLVPGLLPDVTVATAPSTEAEWRLVAVGGKPDRKSEGQAYALSLPSRQEVLTVQDGALALAPAPATPASLVLRHVRDDDPRDGDVNGRACASWPEIETGATGTPQPVRGSAAGRVQGFFEAHVHGMAYEFLGGEVRCGQPWHPYGVEYALGNCQQDGNVLNSALEVGLAGQDPTDPVAAYDPVGWPTFGYWPQHDTLTHEQYYWRWLERAYLGGLRLTTNLLVDNTALCQLFPQKKNSCNEMDGVRLQAQRLFELQDYVDAQSGGPGEGWLRIVTTPAQARQVINAGRLAIVLGVEVSVLFDCGEVLDQPQCTTAQIDERLQEVFDMGVRQMELVNKFDNALSGVTGDGGSTGLVVNTGNKYTTGHFWDMQSCPAEVHDHGPAGDQHDKTQTSPADGAPEGVDALAGRLLQLTAPAKGFLAPLYAPGPHCNTRGLTPLGEHLITSMIGKGMIFDPDHMSASAQRAALDLVEDRITPAERKRAGKERRPARTPAVMSSHSWANDVIYQRIYQLDGVVAPRTGDASSFADRWAQHRAWATANAPKGYDFGLGYGADTNGLGGQPGPREGEKQPLRYTAAGWKAPIGGVVLRQQRSGLKTYDVNRDGVAHYGLFADWFQELRLAADERHAAKGGGNALIADMLEGAETYLGLWERAVYGGGSCVDDGSAPQVEDLHAALGLDVERFLTAIGRPLDREGAAYRYCAEDEDGELGLVEVVFDAAGSAVEVVGGEVAAPPQEQPHPHRPGEPEHRHAGVRTVFGSS